MKAKTKKPKVVDWSLCTYEGAEREQLRRWSALSLREKLSAVEKMGDLATRFLNDRKARGLPYFDPETGKLVNATKLDPHELKALEREGARAARVHRYLPKKRKG